MKWVSPSLSFRVRLLLPLHFHTFTVSLHSFYHTHTHTHYLSLSRPISLSLSRSISLWLIHTCSHTHMPYSEGRAPVSHLRTILMIFASTHMLQLLFVISDMRLPLTRLWVAFCMPILCNSEECVSVLVYRYCKRSLDFSSFCSCIPSQSPFSSFSPSHLFPFCGGVHLPYSSFTTPSTLVLLFPFLC